MAGKMERVYFEEKRELALEGIEYANRTSSEISGLLSSWSYEIPDIIDPVTIHDSIRAVKAQLDGVRRNFEKVRWSAASTELKFNEWLRSHGHEDLVIE